MDGDIFLGLAVAHRDNPCVANGAVVTKDFGDQVVGSFGAFVDHAHELVSAIHAFVCHWCSRFDCGRGRGFGAFDKRLGAFFSISDSSKGERESA